jgi:hypothetical protein
VPGPVGPPVKGSDVLEIVEKQIDDIHRDLDTQMKRIAQIQQQVDELRAAIRRVLPSHERQTDLPLGGSAGMRHYQETLAANRRSDRNSKSGEKA